VSPRWQLTLGVLVLAVLVWQFGTGPFTDAWRLTTWRSVLAALVLTAVATLANAWRWRVVAGALGMPLTVLGSVTAYYRSQFLNSALPGGVLGDAHRGVRHGRAAGDLGLGLRGIVWDRVTGQTVQVLLLAVAVVVMPTPLRAYAPLSTAGVAVCGLLVWVLARRAHGTSYVGRDLQALLRPAVAGRMVLSSCVSSTAHVCVFAVAAATAGVHLGPGALVTVALGVLVGSSLPLNVAGWGPREGVTAGLFALVGLGSATGLTVSIVFGVLAAVATVPGAVVLAGDAVVRRRRAGSLPAGKVLAEVSHG
jgi:uncharacterized membrane protein YbhN (UPF0104 family)